MLETKKQQITEELQHIEGRIKRNFENRFSTKPDDTESGEHEMPDTEEQLEDVLTESQIAVAIVGKNVNDIFTNSQETSINESSENCVQNSTTKDIKSVGNENKELHNIQTNVPSDEDNTKNTPKLNEQMNVTEFV